MDRMRVSLDFPFDRSPERWADLLRRIEEWDQNTRAGSLNRLTDPDPPEEEPWTPARAAEAVTRLAEGRQFTWELFGADDSELGVSLRVLRDYVEVGVTVKRPDDPSKRVAELLRVLDGELFPHLTLAWARDTEDDELLMEGLHRLANAPPLLFLAAPILDRLGVRTALTAAAPAIEIAGGLLLAIADPWKKDAEGKKRRKAIARVLGITASSPLSLL